MECLRYNELIVNFIVFVIVVYFNVFFLFRKDHISSAVTSFYRV